MRIPEPPLLIDEWHFARGRHVYVPDQQCHSCGEYPSWRLYNSGFLACYECFEEVRPSIVADALGVQCDSNTVWVVWNPGLEHTDHMPYDRVVDDLVDHVEVVVKAAFLTVDENPDAKKIERWAFLGAMKDPTDQHLDIDVGFSLVTISWPALCVDDVLAALLVEEHFDGSGMSEHEPNRCIPDE